MGRHYLQKSHRNSARRVSNNIKTLPKETLIMNVTKYVKAWAALFTVVIMLTPPMGIVAQPLLSANLPVVDKCKANCSGANIIKRDARVEIDANTGELLFGSTKFEEGEKVQILFVNKNPFKYRYRFQIVSAPLAAAIATAFLSLIPGFGDILKKVATTPAAAGGPACSGMEQDQMELVDAEVENVKAKLGKVTPVLEKKLPIYEKYEKFVKDTDKDSIDPSECESICQTAQELSQELGQLIDLGNLAKDLQELKDAITKLDAAILTAKPKIKQKPCLDQLAKHEEFAKSASDLREAGDKLVANKKSFEQLQKIVKSVLSMDKPFVEDAYPSTAGGPVGITITIFRTSLRVDDAQEQQVGQPIRIDVGESPLSLSAGIGFSTIEDKRIIRQPFAKPDGTIGGRFGEENKSSFRPSAVIMLNAHLCKLSPFCRQATTFALSTGLVLSSRNGATEAEFIAGPSFGFLKNNIFLTFGYHAARVERLGGGFKIGDEIPANLQDPLPVERNWRSGFMFAITYKLR